MYVVRTQAGPARRHPGGRQCTREAHAGPAHEAPSHGQLAGGPRGGEAGQAEHQHPVGHVQKRRGNEAHGSASPQTGAWLPLLDRVLPRASKEQAGGRPVERAWGQTARVPENLSPGYWRERKGCGGKRGSCAETGRLPQGPRDALGRGCPGEDGVWLVGVFVSGWRQDRRIHCVIQKSFPWVVGLPDHEPGGFQKASSPFPGSQLPLPSRGAAPLPPSRPSHAPPDPGSTQRTQIPRWGRNIFETFASATSKHPKSHFGPPLGSTLKSTGLYALKRWV